MRIRKMQCEKKGKRVIIDGEYYEPKEYLDEGISRKDKRGDSIIAGRERLAEDLRKAIGVSETTSLTWAYIGETARAISRIENAIETMDFLKEHENEVGEEGINNALSYLGLTPIGRKYCEFVSAYCQKFNAPFDRVIYDLSGISLIKRILFMDENGAKYRHLALEQGIEGSWDDLVKLVEKEEFS